MRILTLSLFCLVAAEPTLRGQMGPPAPPVRDDIRKAQPPGLHLKMTLPKDHFYQGEIIDAALEFSNASAAPYHLWIGNYDRSGRISDIAILAQDAVGQPAPDPLAWYFMMGGICGGVGQFQDLGKWTITLPVNQWLRFDRPGVYTLYAWSSRVQKGVYQQNQLGGEVVSLVSDKVRITVDPLTPEMERQVIAEAKAKIALGGDFVAPALAQLRYLGTAAARAELIPLLGNDRTDFDAIMGLCAAPDPTVEADHLLAAVSQGKLPVRRNVAICYARLRTRDLVPKFRAANPTPTEQQTRQLDAQYDAAMIQAQNEITAAALKASGGKGDAYIEALMTKFQQNSRDPAIRAELVKHQLELTNEQATWLLQDWDYVGGDDFLPMVRKMVGELAKDPTRNFIAFTVLAKSKPDEAHALMVADAKLPRSNIFVEYRGYQYAGLHLKPSPLPELDSFLRDKLASGIEPKSTLFYIDEFGSPALLPYVIAHYQSQKGRWSCELEKFTLRYWLRCDPKSGMEALSRALQARAGAGCHKTALEDVLGDRWNDGALPLLTQSLNDPSDDVVLSAVKVLAAHADSTYIDKTIATLERLNGPTVPSGSAPGVMVRGRPSFAARQLLESKNWSYTPEQQKRLEAIAQGQ